MRKKQNDKMKKKKIIYIENGRGEGKRRYFSLVFSPPERVLIALRHRRVGYDDDR